MNLKRNKSLNRINFDKVFSLKRVEFLIGIGEKISFLINLQLSLNEMNQKIIFSIFCDSCYKTAKKGLCLDFKLMTQSMKKRIKIFSYSSLKLEDHFRNNLVFLLFQYRKWAECFKLLVQSMKFGKKRKMAPESFGYWGCVPILIQFFLNKDSTEKSERFKESDRNKRERNPIKRYGFDNWAPALFHFYQILKKNKEFIPTRHFFINLLKKKRLHSFFGVYQNLNKNSFSKIIQLSLKASIICEEVKRIERNLFWNKNNDVSEDLKIIILKKQLVQNFDNSAQKILILKKIRKF